MRGECTIKYKRVIASPTRGTGNIGKGNGPGPIGSGSCREIHCNIIANGYCREVNGIVPGSGINIVIAKVITKGESIITSAGIDNFNVGNGNVAGAAGTKINGGMLGGIQG